MEKEPSFDRKSYNQRVWALVRQIPAGKVVTYGQLALWVNAPAGVAPQGYRAFGARWVGQAMANCPAGLPWQRVINSQGKISLRRGAGLEEQRLLLELEGIVFNEQGRIDLKRFGWSGPGAQELLPRSSSGDEPGEQRQPD